MRRTISPQRLSQEEERLVGFLAGLTGSMIRKISSPQPALTPTGLRLRAFKVVPNLYLGRDLQFYRTPDHAKRAETLSLPETLHWASADAIVDRVKKALTKT